MISAHNNDEALATEPFGMCVCERPGAGLLSPPLRDQRSACKALVFLMNSLRSSTYTISGLPKGLTRSLCSRLPGGCSKSITHTGEQFARTESMGNGKHTAFLAYLDLARGRIWREGRRDHGSSRID